MRAELLGHVVGAEFELARAIADLTRDGANTAASQAQLGALTQLRRDIGTANSASLATLRGDVVAAITQTLAIAQESRALAAASAARLDVTELASLVATSRAQVTALMQDMDRFDPYLRFGSTEDEAAYRQREAERRAHIDAEQAKRTPEGNLNAAGGAIGQMVDAKAHGAGDSPEFQQRWNELVTTTEKLREQVRRSGRSTQEFDDGLREDLRRILRTKGLTDAQIDAQFVTHSDPLDAAKAYVANDDIQNIRDIALMADRSSAASIETTDSTAAEMSMGDAFAKLRVTGVTTAEVSGEFAHGVAFTERASPTTRHV